VGYETRIDLYDVKVCRDELGAVAQAIAAVAGGASDPPLDCRSAEAGERRLSVVE
jgi:hypothetical protein